MKSKEGMGCIRRIKTVPAKAVTPLHRPSKTETRALPHTKRTALIKWPGGKYDEYKHFKDYIPSFDRYYEPFCGGAGVFFAIQPDCPSYLNDVSADLIQFYTQLPTKGFQKELWGYVTAWEQSGVLAKHVGKTLLRVTERYIRGKVDDSQLTDTIRRTVTTLFYPAYTPLFETPFIIDRNTYLQHLKQSLQDKCRRLKIIATKERSVHRDNIMRQLETVVHAAFYTHVRSLHNHYAKHKLHK